jgi:hypothetical protein
LPRPRAGAGSRGSRDSVRAARQRHGQPMDRAEMKRSARGEDVAATFPGTTTRSHLLATTPALCSEQGTQVSRRWETTPLPPRGQEESRCKPTNGPTCRLCPSSVQMRPVFLSPSSATLFLYLWPSIGAMFLQRETVHEQAAREGAREASLERMDVAEERVELYADAIRTGREQSDSMRITSHTSVLKDRQGDESGLSCSLVARSTKDPSDGFVGHARPQRQPGVRIRAVP